MERERVMVGGEGRGGEDQRFESRQGRGSSCSPKPFRLVLGFTLPAIQWIPMLFLGGKAAGA